MCGHLCIPRRRHPSCFPTIRMSNMNSNSSISVELDIADIQIELEDLPKSSHSIGNGADASIPEYKRPDEQRIVSYVINSIQREDEFSFLQLEFLQRLNIVNHEVKLARMKSQVQHDEQASPTQLDELAIAMRDYTTAIRDYQFLRQHQILDKNDTLGRQCELQHCFMRESDYNDPYEDRYLLLASANTHFDSLRKFLLRNLPVQFTYTAAEKMRRTNEYREGRPPQKLAPWVDHLLRFTISFIGGAFVVIPMLIMSFDQSQTKSLIVISSAVVIFGLVVSLGIRVSSIETLVATATYAAVLVVFLGSTTGNGNDSP